MHPLVRRRPPELLVAQPLEHSRFGSESLAVGMLLPEVAEAAPGALPPFAVIPIPPQELFAITIPIRLTERLVPPPSPSRACVPWTVTPAPLVARRPNRNRRRKDTVIVPRRHHMNIEVDSQLAAAKWINVIGPESSAVVPGGRGFRSKVRHRRLIASSRARIGVSMISA
jgi:hypothetical protein